MDAYLSTPHSARLIELASYFCEPTPASVQVLQVLQGWAFAGLPREVVVELAVLLIHSKPHRETMCQGRDRWVRGTEYTGCCCSSRVFFFPCEISFGLGRRLGSGSSKRGNSARSAVRQDLWQNTRGADASMAKLAGCDDVPC